MCEALRFCIDEESFANVGQALRGSLAQFSQLAVSIHLSGQRIARSEYLDDIIVDSNTGTTVCDLLYQRDYRDVLQDDDRLLLIQVLNRCEPLDSTFLPEGTPISIADAPYVSGTVEFVLSEVIAGRAIASLNVKSERLPSGRQYVRRGDIEAFISFVTSEDEATAFYQTVFEIELLTEGEFIRHGRLAFPGLVFVDGLEKQFRR